MGVPGKSENWVFDLRRFLDEIYVVALELARIQLTPLE